MTPPRLSHLNEKGEARMVDVGAKQVTERSATAEGFVAMAPSTLDLILEGKAEKGDVLATARIAGIMAAKRTHELIPLCHPLPLDASHCRFRTAARSVRHPRRGHGEGRGQDRRGDGGFDGRLDCLPHALRYVQGGRPRDVLLRHSPGREDWRPVRRVQGRAVSRQALISHGSAQRRRSSGPRDARARAA